MNKAKLAPIVVCLCFCLMVSWYLGITNPLWRKKANGSTLSGNTDLSLTPLNDDVMLYKYIELDTSIQKFSIMYQGRNIVFYQRKSNSLHDLLNNISYHIRKHKTKKEVHIALLDEDGGKVNVNLSTGLCFKSGKTLKIKRKHYDIAFNPPNIVHGTLPDLILPGFDIFPTILFKYEKGWTYKWYKSLTKDSSWEFIGKGFTYTPDTSDVGHYLKCTIDADMYKLEIIASRTVLPILQSVYYFQERHKTTEKRSLTSASDDFRFVTYNILADVNVQENAYLLNNIEKTVLDIDFRQLILMKEIKGYKADIICFQECELNLFEDYLVPSLHHLGYEGFLTLKTGRKLEGEAMFYRKQKFLHVKDLSISVADAMKKDCNKRIYRKFNKNIPLLTKKAAKTYIGQIHLLTMKSKKQRSLCVLNTHLYWKAKGYLLRFIQMVFLLNYMYSEVKGSDTSIIVTGDLNSLKGNDTVLDYLNGIPVTFCLSGQKTPLFTTRPDVDCAKKPIMKLTSPVPLNYLSSEPDFTFYKNFRGGVYDHVYGTSKLVTKKYIPLIKWDAVRKYKDMVGPMYPSDHTALVFDIGWN